MPDLTIIGDLTTTADIIARATMGPAGKALRLRPAAFSQLLQDLLRRDALLWRITGYERMQDAPRAVLRSVLQR
jgi:hypothetical protein